MPRCRRLRGDSGSIGTVWDAIPPLLAGLADDPDRLTGVDTIGVDEHLWHHQPRPGKGPKEFTGIVDLTRRDGKPRARLLDLVPGRSGKAYADWLHDRGKPFTHRDRHRHVAPVPRLFQRDPRRA
jgi:transposase